jgi:hypothetical protein
VDKGYPVILSVLKYHILPALLAAIMVFTIVPFIVSVLHLRDAFGPAVSWHGVTVTTPVVAPGSVLGIVYRATINRACPSDIRGFLVAPDGTVPVRFPTVFGGYTLPADGPVDIKVSILIPQRADVGLAPLGDGDYVYRVLVTRYCPAGVEHDHFVPDARFTLRVPK